MRSLKQPWWAVHWRYGTSMHLEADEVIALLLERMEKYGRPKQIFLSTNCQALKEAFDVI